MQCLRGGKEGIRKCEVRVIGETRKHNWWISGSRNLFYTSRQDSCECVHTPIRQSELSVSNFVRLISDKWRVLCTEPCFQQTEDTGLTLSHTVPSSLGVKEALNFRAETRWHYREQHLWRANCSFVHDTHPPHKLPDKSTCTTNLAIFCHLWNFLGWSKKKRRLFPNCPDLHDQHESISCVDLMRLLRAELCNIILFQKCNAKCTVSHCNFTSDIYLFIIF